MALERKLVKRTSVYLFIKFDEKVQPTYLLIRAYRFIKEVSVKGFSKYLNFDHDCNSSFE